MYLSRLILNPRHRAVRRDLADCQALHRTIMAAFPDLPAGAEARARLGVLYRLEIEPRTGRTIILVQSRQMPDWSRLAPGYLLDTGGDPENPACKEISHVYARIEPGMVFAFRLQANPTRKIDTRSGPDGRRRNGRRVELVGEEAQLDWLRRKAAASGFELMTVRANPVVLSVTAVPGGKLIGLHPDGLDSVRRMTFAVVRFDGLLRVTNADRFRTALVEGIGPGKAYGLGLLSIARPAE
jgi:CRISPR system Cascade subunit CasE